MKIVFFIVSYVVSVSCCFPSSSTPPKENVVPVTKEAKNVSNINPTTKNSEAQLPSMDVMKKVGISMSLEKLKEKLGKLQIDPVINVILNRIHLHFRVIESSQK